MTASWRDRIKVHPAADAFDMMDGDELDATARDIEANGLREGPAWFQGPDGLVLLDGRNRVAAVFRIADPKRRAELEDQLKAKAIILE